MFGKSSLPPPPSVNQSRNESLGPTLSTYRNRPAGSTTAKAGGIGAGLNFSSVRSMFETAKPMGAAVAGLARNPLIQNAAVAAAKDEKLRSTAVAAAKNPHVRSAAVDFAMAQSSTANKSTAQQLAGWSKGAVPIASSNFSSSSSKVDEIARQFENRPIMGFSAVAQPTSFADAFATVVTAPLPIGPKPATKSIYPTLAQRNPFDFPPQLPSTQTTALYDDTPLVADYGSGYGLYQKKTAPPSRPPPPKITQSRSNPNLNWLADELRGIDFSATAASPPPGSLNEPYAIVKYPYREANADELTCQPDDVVILKREVDDQWIYATNTRTGRSGIVPLLFLQICVPLAPMNRKGSTIGANKDDQPIMGWQKTRNQMSGQCFAARALYDYATGIEGDLQFNAGDTIVVNSRVNAEWLRGETSGRSGIFPLNYVTLDNPAYINRLSDEHSSIAEANAETLTAAFDYVSDVSGDLSFRAGDRVVVLKRHDGGQWVTGQLERTGETGLVPLTYMQPLSV